MSLSFIHVYITVSRSIPFAGAIIYLLVGENRISDKRVARMRESQDHYQYWLNSLRGRSPVDWQDKADICLPLHRQAEELIGIPALAGNSLKLIDREAFISASQ